MASIETQTGETTLQTAPAALRNRIAGLRVMQAAVRLHYIVRKAGFDPNQPRVPRGHSDGGQWTRGGGGSAGGAGRKPGSRLAQNTPRGRGGSSIRIGGRRLDATPRQRVEFAIADSQAQRALQRVRELDPTWKPRPSIAPPQTAAGAIALRRAEAREAAERIFALRSISTYRRENNFSDLFGREGWRPDQGTVAITTLRHGPVAGVNSRAPGYTRDDRSDAQIWVRRLVVKYPEVMNTRNLGRKPNDALYHAEATLLLRAARARRGTLEGDRFVVHTDRTMCRSCREVLPRLGLELGNPTVTFVGPGGVRRTMRNGHWIKSD